MSCCDPSQLPQASRGAAHKRELPMPNHLTIPGRSSVFAVDIAIPSRIVPTAVPAAKLYAFPVQPNDTTNLARSMYSGYELYLPSPGRWFIYYDSTATLEADVIADGLDPASALFYKKDGYTVATHSQATLATATATTVLAANVRRHMCAFQNNGSVHIRLRWDGTNPTTSTGIRLSPGQTLVFEGDELIRTAVVAIEESGSGVLDIVEGI